MYRSKSFWNEAAVHVAACTPLVIEPIGYSGNMSRETCPWRIATPLT
jgi:hypothetical protein